MSQITNNPTRRFLNDYLSWLATHKVISRVVMNSKCQIYILLYQYMYFFFGVKMT